MLIASLSLTELAGLKNSALTYKLVSLIFILFSLIDGVLPIVFKILSNNILIEILG